MQTEYQAQGMDMLCAPCVPGPKRVCVSTEVLAASYLQVGQDGCTVLSQWVWTDSFEVFSNSLEVYQN